MSNRWRLLQALRMRPVVAPVRTRRPARNFESLEPRYALASGDIDVSFGTQGQATTEFYDSQTWGRSALAVSVDTQKRIVTVGEGAMVRLLSDGQLDSTFGIDGRVALPYYARAVSFQSDGKIIVAGGTDKNNSQDFVIARYTDSGQLDASFQGNGVFQLDLGNAGEVANAIYVDDSDRISVAGGSGDNIAVARLLAGGQLDSNFATGGMFVKTFHRSDTAFAVTGYTNGRLLVGGTSLVTVEFNRIDYDMSILRLNEDGTVDRTFSGDGIATVNFTSSAFSRDQGRGLAVQADGRILITGAVYGNFAAYSGLARLMPNGSLDNGFAVEGRRIDSVGSDLPCGQVILPGDGSIIVTNVLGIQRFDATGNPELTFGTNSRVVSGGIVNAATLDDDQSIVIAGSFAGEMGVRRYLATGAADMTFSLDGLQTISNGPSVDLAAQAVVQSDGKIVTVGSSQKGFAVSRHLANGTLDPNFTGDGLAVFGFGSAYQSAQATSLAVQPNGKIVVAGWVMRVTSGFSDADFAVLRLNSDGTLDSTFSNDGLQITDLGGFDQAFGVVVQANGKIILGGVSGSGAATLVRYNVNGDLDTQFNADGIAPMATLNSRFSRILLQSDGKILAAGQVAASNSASIYGSTLMVARFNSNGFLDTSFGSGGKMVDPQSAQRTADDIVIQPDGNFLVVGDAVTRVGTNGINNDIAVSRYNANGSKDGVFGTVLIPQVEPSLNNEFDDGYVSSYGSGLLLQANGRIIVTGHAGARAFVARLNSDGTRDSSFAGDGIQTFGTTGAKLTAASVVQSTSGRIILVGTSERFHFDQVDRDFLMVAMRDQTEAAHATVVSVGTSGNIEINDHWSRDNQWNAVLSVDGLRISDMVPDSRASIQVVGLPQVVVNSREILIPLAATGGRPVLINGNSGNDRLSVSSSISLPANLLMFRGGLGDDWLSLAETNSKNDFLMTSVTSGGVSTAGIKSLTYTGLERLIGGQGDDSFRLNFSGSPERVRIDGNGGNNDTLTISADANMSFTRSIVSVQRLVVEATARQEYAIRGIEHATLNGGPSNNRLDARQFNGSTKLVGYGGDDELFAGGGRSMLYGEDGNDQLFGGLADDSLFGGNGHDLLVGYDGQDTLSGGSGFDILVGGFGIDTLIGGSDDDLLIGGNSPLLRDVSEAAARDAILAAWRSSESLTSKIQLLGTTGVGPNNSIKLQVGNNVFEDFVNDKLVDDLAQSWVPE